MPRHLLVPLLLGLLLPAPTRGAEGLFPRPSALEPRIGFWKRIYAELDTDHGLLHDARDVRIVYEVISLPEKLSPRTRDRRIRARREHWKGVVRRLAQGKRKDLSAEERRVLALFPKGVRNSTLREASRRIRFQRGQANRFRQGLIRQGRWEAYMRQLFRDRGLPEELTALPHVESSFNPEAHSHVGASGLWQFTRSTGRLYMQVDHVVDERRDPYLATVAAARLLKANHERLRTWPLAITAYNHGAGGMDRAVRRLGTRDIAVILERYQSRTFGFASRNFYCEFLAALDVQEHAERYFGPLRKEPAEQPEIVVLKDYVKASDLAALFGIGTQALRGSNPALLTPIWTGQKLVPRGYGLRLPRDPMRSAPEQVLAQLAPEKRHARQLPDRTYRVRRGDTLSRIAHRHGVRESDLVALNGLRNRHRIRVGQVLKLPIRGGATYVPPRPPRVATVAADGRYRVQPGDTLSGIARRFGVPQQRIVLENGLRDRDRLRVGQVLRLPVTREAARGAVYTIRRGDTIDGIARRFGVSRSALVAANSLRDAHRIHIGQKLVIPGR